MMFLICYLCKTPTGRLVFLNYRTDVDAHLHQNCNSEFVAFSAYKLYSKWTSGTETMPQLRQLCSELNARHPDVLLMTKTYK